MGNEQSAPVPVPAPAPAPAPAPRRLQNKLSKPKTNNNSNANLLSTQSAAQSRRNSVSTNNEASARYRDHSKFLDEALGDAIEKQKKPATQKKRLSLFRTRSDQTKPSQAELDFGTEKELIEPQHVDRPSHRWSRALRRKPVVVESFGEVPYTENTSERSESKPPNRSRISLQLPTFPEQHSRLSLVTEFPFPQPEPRDGSKMISRYGQEESDAQASNMGSRRGSDADMYVPIRRRSLLQHGVATRTTAFAQNDPRQSLPSQRQASLERQNHYYEYNDSRQSLPSQRQASLERQNQCYEPNKAASSSQGELVMLGPNSAFAVPGPRTETPTEIDYRHTGAFKLGTLRITNGAASPSPSRDGRASSLGAEDEYTAARKSVDSMRRLNQRSNTLSVATETRKAPWIVKSESPLRQSHDKDFKPLTIDIPNVSLALFDSKELFKSTHSPTKALELAHEYQQEIALSPFSFDNSPVPSPRLESTSKHTAIEDDLFAPDASTPKMEGTPRMPRSFDSGYEGGPMKKVKGPPEQPPKPLTKTDSGYNSNVSLRSFKKGNSPAVPAKDLVPAPTREMVSRVPSSTYSVNSSIRSEATLHRERSLPALPKEQSPPSGPDRQVPAVPLKALPYSEQPVVPSASALRKSIEQPSAATKAKPQPHLQVPSKTSRRKTLPAVANITREKRETSPTISETSVTSSTSSSSRWPLKKLNKRPQSVQPAPEPVYTVQAFRSPSEQMRIPVPSVEVRQQLEQRVDAFPVVSFPNTISRTSQLRRTASKETLKTIFSVGSLEVREELRFARLHGALPPLPKQATIPEDPNPPWQPRPDFNKRHTFQVPESTSAPAPTPAPVPAPAPTPAPRQEQPKQPRSSFQRPSSRDYSPAAVQAAETKHIPDFETHLTSYQNISSSVGKSPYEAALAVPKQQKPAANERTNSMTAQFEADAATRYGTNRAVSQESQASTIVRSRKSYDSIANGNPFHGESTNNSRVSSREFRAPPQAHANGRRLYSLQYSQSSESISTYRQEESNYSNEEVEVEDKSQRYSSMARTQKPKAAPPISMSTQRNRIPTPVGSHQIAPPSRTSPVSQQQPPHPLQQRPAAFASQQQVQDESIADRWKQSAGAWAERRQSAGEALVARRSMEMSRPAPFHPAHSQSRIQPEPQPHQLRERRSMDANFYGQKLSRPGSARPSGEYVRPQVLQGGKSFDTSQRSQGKMWNVGVGYETPSNYSKQPQYQHQQYQQQQYQQQQYQHQQYQHQQYQNEEYNHTYGSTEFSHYNKENTSWRNQYSEQEYYEPEYYESEPKFEPTEAQYLPEAIHKRNTSTSEMLILDRFSGGLGYGYEPGLGLVASAGTRSIGKMGGAGRKSVGTMQYGVDLADAPVFLQRVKMES